MRVKMRDEDETAQPLGERTGALERLALETSIFTIGGRDWSIRSARDHAALLDVADGLVEFPFGLLLWESAPVLAEALVERAGDIVGRRVLELGAGAGLGGIVARALGAAAVVQTDHIAEALVLCRWNAAANGVSGIELRRADWSAWTDDGLYDVVIGSDVLYDRAAHEPFAAILERNLAPGGRVLLADPGRQDTPLFLDRMRAAGWRIARTSRTVDTLLPGGADTVEIAVLDMRRGEVA